MMKTVIITRAGWVDSFPVKKRPDIMRMIFSLASEYHWGIAVAGQHWGREAP